MATKAELAKTRAIGKAVITRRYGSRVGSSGSSVGGSVSRLDAGLRLVASIHAKGTSMTTAPITISSVLRTARPSTVRPGAFTSTCAAAARTRAW